MKLIPLQSVDNTKNLFIFPFCVQNALIRVEISCFDLKQLSIGLTKQEMIDSK